jgi:dTDP-glucose pyrophosphorylase
MQILVPIAARSTFFPAEDYPFPKPLIEVASVPMIERVVENLKSVSDDVRFIFVVSQEDVANFSLDQTLNFLTDGACDIVALKAETDGALCSCLMAVSHLVGDEELIIANGDQIIDVDLAERIKGFRASSADAGVLSFPSVHPRWSFVKLDEQGLVRQAAEKKVISKNAVAGFYYFKRADSFVDAAMATIESDRHVNGLFYIAPALNELVLKGQKVAVSSIRKEQYHSFYSPGKIEDFTDYLIASNRLGESTGYGRVNLVIPAAGQGSRFAKAGYEKPKPFIEVLGRPMIEHVIDNVSVRNSATTLLLRTEHVQHEKEAVQRFQSSGLGIVQVEKLTEGTACTVLLGRKHFDNDDALLIANSDQYVDFDCQAFVDDCFERNLDGSILVFKDPTKNPKWSFAKLDEKGHVTEVAEKKPISDLATVGIYLFRRGSDFVSAAVDMIAVNERVNNEFYTCPVYNYMIANGLKIGVYEVDQSAMHGLGTPEDLDSFLAHRAGK